MIQVISASNFNTRVIFCCAIFPFLLFLIINCFSVSGAISEVDVGDTWDYTVEKAYMAFLYSSGIINFRSSTQGYRLENTLVPIQEEITVTVISFKTTPQTTIIYEVSWENTTVVVNSSSFLTDYGLQESLGRGVLGSGYDFLFSDTGVTIGDWVFIVPEDTLLSSLQIWNKSTLPGAIEGMETILDLGDEENEKDYHMWISYQGNMENESFGLNLQFMFNADFRWEKNKGVLLAYEITTSMQGTYQSNDASFNLELKLQRTDLNDFLGHNVSSFDLLILSIALLVLAYSRTYLRK